MNPHADGAGIDEGVEGAEIADETGDDVGVDNEAGERA